jgi:hypothetical protein
MVQAVRIGKGCGGAVEDVATAACVEVSSARHGASRGDVSG